ncbi:MAG: hypothetical protein U0996_07165 [Planctomycetaceae bacterium]
MKQTVFRFELRIDPAAPEAALQGLKDKLSTLKDVLSIDTEATGYGTTLVIRVCFEDSEGAKKLHRKVMNKIIGHESVTISQVTTKLTDIF